MRWIALAACVVVVGPVVISRTHFSPSTKQTVSSNQPDVVARNEPRTSPSAPPAEESRAKSQPTTLLNRKALRVLLRLSEIQIKLQNSTKNNPRIPPFGDSTKDGRPEDSYDRLEAKNNKLPAASGVINGAPAATETVTVESASFSGGGDESHQEGILGRQKQAQAAGCAATEIARGNRFGAHSPVPPSCCKAAPSMADSLISAGRVAAPPWASAYKQQDEMRLVLPLTCSPKCYVVMPTLDASPRVAN